MKMTLPNKLTLLRIIMVPFFVAALLYRDGTDSLARWLSLALFLIASFTDFLDGYIARKYHLITNFGKFMDPRYCHRCGHLGQIENRMSDGFYCVDAVAE